jgi:hypothetical protein
MNDKPHAKRWIWTARVYWVAALLAIYVLGIGPACRFKSDVGEVLGYDLCEDCVWTFYKPLVLISRNDLARGLIVDYINWWGPECHVVYNHEYCDGIDY